MTVNPLPHMVTLVIEDGYSRIERVDCPYTEMGSDRPCALMDENPDPKPVPPPEGPPIFKGGMAFRHEGDVLVPVEPDDPWFAYEHALDVRPTWVPVNACWVVAYVQESGLDASDILHGELSFTVPMDWGNEGGVEDACLVLRPWSESPFTKSGD